MKTDFEARPVYLRVRDRIKRPISNLLSGIADIWDSGIQTGQENIQQRTIIDTLRSMDVCALDTMATFQFIKRTDLTDDLHELFGFPYRYSDYQEG